MVLIDFVWPQTNGEWLAWLSAIYLLIFGLGLLFVPRLMIYWNWTSRVSQKNLKPAIILARGPMAGANIGLAIAILMLHPQPLLYLALGLVFSISAVTRIVSIFADKHFSFKYCAIVLVDCGLAYSPLAYSLGYIR